MVDPELLTIAATFVIAAAIVFFVALLASRNWKTQSDDTASNASEGSEEDKAAKDEMVAKKKAKKDRSRPEKPGTYSHPWLASNLKGHTGKVLDMDFSSNGRHLISTDEDRSLILWSTKDFMEKEHKMVRGSVELDEAKLVRFAPDSRSLILVLSFANRLAVYKIAKKEDGGSTIQPLESVDYQEKHNQAIICAGISCNGKFIMTASADTTLIVWGLRGEVLKILDTKQSNIHHAAVSPCGRFVAASGFTPDVLVWEVHFNRAGEFQDVQRAFELKGHTSGVYQFDFNQDSTKMLTVSKDGSWRLWDTDIRYQQGQEPYLVAVGSLEQLRTTPASLVKAALAPNGDSFAIALGTQLRVYLWRKAEEADWECVLEQVHSAPIISIRFSADSKFLVTAGDRHLRVFHNMAFHKALARNTALELTKPHGDAHMERLRQQLKDANRFLAQILGPN